jgi:type IV fimbrial biogenesis protein FimT
MVTVSIVVLLTVLAVPGLGALVTKIRMDGEINAVVSALNFARSEAVKRGQTVSVCPGTTATCGAGTSWTSGWVVSLPGTTAQLLQKTDAYSGTDTLISTSAATPSYPQFTPMGYTFFTGTLTLHDGNSTPSLYRCLVFNTGTWTSVTGSACP